MQMNYTKNNWSKSEYNDFIDVIKSLADEKYKKFHSSLIPNIEKMLGITVPTLRNIAKSIAKGNWRDYLEVCGDYYFEEKMLQGFVLNSIKVDNAELFNYMDKFIPKIDNWSTCDTFCTGMKAIKNDKQFFFPYIKGLTASKEAFAIRTGIVLLLSHYIDDDYIDEILLISNSIKYDHYYVKMANAWLISVCYVKFREKTLAYLYNNKLDDWTHNKAIQKTLESLRIDKADRELLKSLKRKKFN